MILSPLHLPNFDPNLQQLLAVGAQQLAIHSKHFSSFNAALYLLSKGPWIPLHISVHVRQAALAAVGVGWSCNQVPTAFPFSHFDASVSLATLDDIPSSEATQVDAVFAIYAPCVGISAKAREPFCSPSMSTNAMFVHISCNCQLIFSVQL